MARFLLPFLLAGFCAQDDLDSKVSRLLEQMRDGDIAAREKAEAALADLGSAAVPILKARVAGLDAEVRLRVESAIRRIDRRAKLLARTGRVPLVTLQGSRSVHEAVQEFNRQSGQTVTLQDVPADLKATAAIENQPCWTALDALCRANGKLQWQVQADGVVVRPGPARDLARVSRGQFFFFIDRIIIERDGDHGSICIIPWLLWPAGRTPDVLRLRVAELADDTGLDLRQTSPPRDDDDTPQGSLEEAARRIGRRFWYWNGMAPAAGATTLAKFSGTVTAQYSLEEVVEFVGKPESMIGKTFTMGRVAVKLRSLRRAGERVRMVLDVGAAQGDPFPELRDFALSGGGVRVRSRGSITSSFGAQGQRTATFECEFVFPAGAGIGSLDLLRDAEVQTVEIPFDFAGLRIR